MDMALVRALPTPRAAGLRRSRNPVGRRRIRARCSSCGSKGAKSLLEATPNDQIPEIPSEKTGIKAMVDQLPKVVDKFSSLEDQAKKVVDALLK